MGIARSQLEHHTQWAAWGGPALQCAHLRPEISNIGTHDGTIAVSSRVALVSQLLACQIRPD
eukprot:6205055-Amphidinium_carterae.1